MREGGEGDSYARLGRWVGESRAMDNIEPRHCQGSQQRNGRADKESSVEGDVHVNEALASRTATPT